VISRRAFLGSLAGGLLAAPLVAGAQQAAKIYRIGLILTGTPTETGHLIKALSDGLRELGYVEGRNVVFEISSSVSCVVVGVQQGLVRGGESHHSRAGLCVSRDTQRFRALE
jgi:hypothetical protein